MANLLVSPAFDSARNSVTDLCSCPVKGSFKTTESDILNYKNTVSALSSQEFENVLPHLLFVHIHQIHICFVHRHTMYLSLLCYLLTVCIFCEFLCMCFQLSGKAEQF